MTIRIAALVLAGGRGSRLGATVPKPLVELGGRTLLRRVLDAIPEEIGPVILNAPMVLDASESQSFQTFGLSILADRRTGFAGPLAGLEAAWHAQEIGDSGATHLLVLPGDTPFLTRQALAPLLAEPGDLPRVARHEGQLQPTVALWPLSSLERLSAFLETPGQHSIRAYLDRTGFKPIDIEGDDPFFNVNTPADLDAAERRLSSG